jgi:NTE family protein
MPAHREKARIGIALSGGTLKAAAHAGVLMALEELGVRPHCVAGTSAGSWVATLYAHGFTGEDLLTLVQNFPGIRLLDYGYPLLSSLRSAWYYARHRMLRPGAPLPSGVLKGRRLADYFRRVLDDRTAVLPYYIVATDLISGKPIVFTNDTTAIHQHHGTANIDPAVAVLASCALPGIFPPVSMSPWLLVDGAFRHYVPVDILRTVGCNKIIVVNLYRLQRHWLPRTAIHVLVRALDILLQESIDNDLAGTDVWILRPDVRDMSWWSIHQLRACMKAGMDSVRKTAPGLLAWLEETTCQSPDAFRQPAATRPAPYVVSIRS